MTNYDQIINSCPRHCNTSFAVLGMWEQGINTMRLKPLGRGNGIIHKRNCLTARERSDGFVFGLPKRGGDPHLGLMPGDEGLVRFEEPNQFGEGSCECC